MKKILYIDMDGVINLFENDPDARTNMWEREYFCKIEPRKNIRHDLLKISKYVDEIVIITKCINRHGVRKEKEEFIHKYLSNINNLSVVYVPYNKSKADYIDPNTFCILVDDNIKNIEECEKKCNICILFDEYNRYQYKNRIKNVVDIIKFLQ